MKRTIITLMLALVITTGAFAAKSLGMPMTFQQSDGTTITVQLLGDEHICWYQTLDNVLLVRENNGFFVAKQNEDGTLSSTGCLAHNATERSFIETNLILKQDKESYFQKADAKLANIRKVISGYPSNRFSPHMGNMRIPIILMNYADSTFTLENPNAVFDEYFNGETKYTYSKDTKNKGYSSVRQFFTDASGGKFTPQFDIYGPYTANNGHNYYGNNQGTSHEINLLYEAVKKADADIDFSQYDSNDDGKVDIVYIIYAGTGANISGDTNDFWPACWYDMSISTEEGKKINVIGGSNELATYAFKSPSVGNLRAGIGVFCHEMSHGLGLPDLYWTLTSTPKDADGYADYNNCGPEDWDLMDGGENLYNGIWPCQYTAWERDIMGWLDVIELNEPLDVTIYPLNDAQGRGKAYRVTNPENPKEYYIIENYQSNEWNQYISNNYGAGLMITHLNSYSTGFTMACNNTYGKPNITILPADGLILASYSSGKTFPYKGEVITMPTGSDFSKNYFKPDLCGDPYPGSQNVTSIAAYKNYTGDDMVNKFPITDIQKNSDDGSISFKFMGGSPSIKGDVNKDSYVDVADINAIIAIICGTEEKCSNADVNNDGNVDIADVNDVISIICKSE